MLHSSCWKVFIIYGRCMICLSCLITTINRKWHLQNCLYMDAKRSIIQTSRKGNPKEKKNMSIFSPVRESVWLFILFLLYTKVFWMLENSVSCVFSCMRFRYWILSTTVTSVFKSECKRYIWHVAVKKSFVINNYREIFWWHVSSVQTFWLKKKLICSNSKGDTECTRRKTVSD